MRSGREYPVVQQGDNVPESRPSYRLPVAALMLSMTTACGSSDPRFHAGTWHLESWLEGEVKGPKAGQMSNEVVLDERFADLPARDVFFSKFYLGVKSGNVTFEDGVVSGSIDQGAVAPFPAHSQAMTGWYKSTAFEVRIAMPKIADVQSYQVVKGQLASPDD